MSKEINVLEDFFNQDIFDRDEIEVETFLGDYTDAQIFDNLIRKLQISSLPDSKIDSDDISWKLGRIMGDYNKIPTDKLIIFKLTEFSLDMKIAYMSFLSGYWDEATPDLDSMISFSTFVTNLINSNNKNEKLVELSVEAIAVAYGNNKDIFDQNNLLLGKINDIKKYTVNNLPNCPGKELLSRL